MRSALKRIVDEYQPDPQLLSLIQGKRVALIGPAPYLTNRHLGDFFDCYDVVCRITNFDPPATEDYGSRTDVLFDACDYRAVENGVIKLKRNEKLAKRIKLVYLPWADLFESEHPDRLSVFDARKMIYEDSGFNLSWTHVGAFNFSLLWQQIGCEPNSGMLSFAILMAHQVKELLVTGLTFYLDACGDPRKAYYADYFDGEINAIYDQPNFFDGHSQVPQIEFFKESLKAAGNIAIDSHLETLLGVTHSMVLDLNG